MNFKNDVIILTSSLIVTFLLIVFIRNYFLKKYEEAIKSWFTSMFSFISEGIFVIGNDGKIIFGNELGEKIIGNVTSDVNIENCNVVVKCAITQEEIPIKSYYYEKSLLSFKGHIITDVSESESRDIYVGTFIPLNFPSKKFSGTFVILKNISKEIDSEEIIYNMTNYDAVTGVPNKNYFLDYLNLSIQNAKMENRMVGLLLIDLDNFKTVNDIMGHTTGDALLKLIASTLKGFMTQGAQLARIGGDEFAIVLPSIIRIEEAIILVRKIINLFRNTWEVEDKEYYITASIGISIYPHEGNDAQTLHRNADTALNNAKESGKNNYKFYTRSMNTTIIERFDAENSLRHAVEKDEFVVYYQPLVDSKTLRIKSAEALVRWQHPTKGIVGPYDFIPIAEETGLINNIGEIVLRKSCIQLKKWMDEGFNISISVNCSARQFRNNNLLNLIERVVRETKIDPRLLEIEITESFAMNNIDYVIHILNEFKKMGITIAVDDFGTGYSSINYLKLLPIDSLKIDRSFIGDIENSTAQREIVRALISLAHGIELKVTAEGVETMEQLEFLQKHNCDRLQGFLFSKPVPAEKFEELFKVDLKKNIHSYVEE